MMRAVLTYHSIDETGSPISIAPEAFQRHVAWLTGGSVRVQSLSALLADSENGHHEPAVALTFDDGIANFAEYAAPVLRDHDLPATLFVVADHVGRDNRWGGTSQAGIPDLPLLDWDALERLAKAGVAIGAHTRTHPRLTRLSATAVEDELLTATDEIAARLGARPDSFAYPYGDCNDAVASVARTAFRWACTTEFRALRSREDHARIPRLDACSFRAPGHLEAWGSPGFRLGVGLRATARRMRRLLHTD
ncbi:MAG: polysaccharide deacetylase family protein [Gemmatimonadaceae bacterium]|nr:polysaccharide deacetylase family protein [Gemmatimonadaceae bacterium]